MSEGGSVRKHHGLAAVQDNAVLKMVADGARQHASLDVASLADEILGRVAMADALDVLIDDRPLVEIARDVMGGGANQLHAALVGLMIGLGALEARQEGMVDVDAAPRQLGRKLVGKD